MSQFQITQIANGWLVATPPSVQVICGQQVESAPKMVYCATFEEVCNALKKEWPVVIS